MMRFKESPGTTPLVAMALIDIAVSIVCRGKEKIRLKWRRTYIQTSGQVGVMLMSSNQIDTLRQLRLAIKRAYSTAFSRCSLEVNKITVFVMDKRKWKHTEYRKTQVSPTFFA